MATLKGQTIAASYQDLVKRADTYSQTGTNIEIMNDSAVVQPTGLYLESGATTDNVGIGVADPDATLEILDTTTQLKLSYDATNYATFNIAADGLLTITTVDPDGAEADIILAPDGNVGIGTAAPANLLELEFANAVDSYTAANIADNTVSGIVINNTNTVTGHGGMLKFTSKDGDNMTAITHTQEAATSASLRFFTESSGTLAERMKIEDDVTITGDLIMADGKGIDFSADANAAGMTAEILDDYEEGTWTPTNNGGTITFTTLSSPYTKIGREVHIQAYLSLSSDGASSAISLGGLPFAAASGGYAPSILNAGQTNGKVVLARVHSSATTLNFYDAVSQGTINEDEIDNAHVIFQITYNV